jgi:hypothetical protein
VVEAMFGVYFFYIMIAILSFFFRSSPLFFKLADYEVYFEEEGIGIDDGVGFPRAGCPRDCRGALAWCLHQRMCVPIETFQFAGDGSRFSMPPSSMHDACHDVHGHAKQCACVVECACPFHHVLFSLSLSFSLNKVSVVHRTCCS